MYVCVYVCIFFKKNYVVAPYLLLSPFRSKIYFGRYKFNEIVLKKSTCYWNKQQVKMSSYSADTFLLFQNIQNIYKELVTYRISKNELIICHRTSFSSKQVKACFCPSLVDRNFIFSHLVNATNAAERKKMKRVLQGHQKTNHSFK